MEFEAAAHGGELDGRGVLRVADEAVGDAEGEVVHGAGGWDADVPVADAAGVILEGGLRATFEEFDGVAGEGEGAEEGRGDFAGDELGRGDDFAEVAEVGFGAVDGGGVERGGEFGESFGAVFAVDDDLRDHGVVEGGDGGAGFDPGFYARDFWRREGDEGELAGGGLEVVGGVFGVDAGFDGGAAGLDVEARERRHFAGGLQDHPLDEIDAGDFFGDAVLDLEAGVDFEEIELLGVVVVDELDGAGGGVGDGLGEEGGGGLEAGAGFVGEAGGGRFFENFLVAALRGAVAFA